MTEGDNGRLIHLSKFPTLILRRRPGLIGLTLDEGGWVDVGELPAAAEQHGRFMTAAELMQVVAGDAKGRYVLRVDAAAMHAAGHLFYLAENGVWLTEAVPPAFLRRQEWSGFLTPFEMTKQRVSTSALQHFSISAEMLTI
jgi:putative RNA 2'-phosphotransferase